MVTKRAVFQRMGPVRKPLSVKTAVGEEVVWRAGMRNRSDSTSEVTGLGRCGLSGGIDIANPENANPLLS